MKSKIYSLPFILLITCIIYTQLSFAASTAYSATLILPEDSDFAIPLEYITEVAAFGNISGIVVTNAKKSFILRVPQFSNPPYSEEKSLELSHYEGDDAVFLLFAGGGFTDSITFALPVSDVAYEFDIYRETSPDTYLLYKSNLAIYNFPNGDASLTVPLETSTGIKYRFVFRNFVLKNTSNDLLSSVSLNKHPYPEAETSSADPLEIYRNKLQDGRYETLYDFGHVVFIDGIRETGNLSDIFTSRTGQIFTAASIADLSRGIYARFLRFSTESSFSGNLSFVSHRRFLIVSGKKGDSITIGINTPDSINIQDMSSSDGTLGDMRIIIPPAFEEIEILPAQTTDETSLLIYLLVAIALFLVYPLFLLYRSVRFRLSR